MDIDSLSLEMLRVDNLFKPGNTVAWDFLCRYEWIWEALPDVCGFIQETGAALDGAEYETLPNNVWIHKTAVIAPTAYIGSNLIIGPGAEVRHCAFLRDSALVGSGAVVGHFVELKNVIMFDQARAAHYNYVGDSMIGYKAHMGAGAITSNVKSDNSNVSVVCSGTRLETGMRKFGAILGDRVEIGCNSVLNPGCIVGSDTMVYPLSMVRGIIPPGCIYKKQGEVVSKHR